jgi:formylglycine-generating enzyme
VAESGTIASMQRSLSIALGLAVAASACTLFTDLDGFHGDEPATSEDAGPSVSDAEAPVDGAETDAGAEIDADADAACRGTKGPTSLRVGSFCIDTTEVTGRHYGEFLAAKAGDTSGQPPECAWNTSFETVFSANTEVPIRGVDWCDARAFCAWAGKRLCGHLEGGPLPNDLRGNAFADAWYYACSNGGTQAFPYGDTHDPSACNLPPFDGGGPRPVGTIATCEGGFPGLFDMSGNVWEWQDSCESDAADARCAGRGASYAAETQGSCTSTFMANRDAKADIGIRCCSD